MSRPRTKLRRDPGPSRNPAERDRRVARIEGSAAVLASADCHTNVTFDVPGNETVQVAWAASVCRPAKAIGLVLLGSLLAGTSFFMVRRKSASDA